MYTGECILEKCILENMYRGVYTGDCIIRDCILEHAKWSVYTGECVMENVCWRVYTEAVKSIHLLSTYTGEGYAGECIMENV